LATTREVTRLQTGWPSARAPHSARSPERVTAAHAATASSRLAGTGTGKTLGYLVPLLLSGRKAIVSTGTRNAGTGSWSGP